MKIQPFTLEQRLQEYAMKHKPEQTLICVDLQDTTEYCYLTDCLINTQAIVWRYLSDNHTQVCVVYDIKNAII